MSHVSSIHMSHVPCKYNTSHVSDIQESCQSHVPDVSHVSDVYASCCVYLTWITSHTYMMQAPQVMSLTDDKWQSHVSESCLWIMSHAYIYNTGAALQDTAWRRWNFLKRQLPILSLSCNRWETWLVIHVTHTRSQKSASNTKSVVIRILLFSHASTTWIGPRVDFWGLRIAYYVCISHFMFHTHLIL